MGRGRHVAHVSPVIHRPDFAFVEEGSAAAEDEIHRAVDSAAAEALGEHSAPAQLRGEKAVIPLDQVLRQRADEQRVLGGAQRAVLTAKVVPVHRQGNLLSLFGRFQGVIDDGEVFQCHAVGAHGQRPGAKGVVFLPVRVNLLCVVPVNKGGFLRPRTDDGDAGCLDHHLLPVYAFRQMNDGAFCCAVKYRLEILSRLHGDFMCHGSCLPILYFIR